MTFARKTLTAAVAALAVGATSLATLGSADAGQRYGYGRHYYVRGPSAGPVVAGVIGGLALGALAASAARPAYAYNSGYGYAPSYGDGYAYSGYAEPYETQCFIQKQRVYDNWGNYVGKRAVRVCQ